VSNKSRNQIVFEEELFPHMDALKTFAYHLSYNEEDANDLVQETYMKAHRFIDKYDQGTNAKAWLFKILKNAYINEYRKSDEVTIAINSLPIDFRTVILLCDIEGFTYEEISKIIDVPIGTVRSRLFRARNMLKEKLKAYAEKMGYEDKRGAKRKASSEEE